MSWNHIPTWATTIPTTTWQAILAMVLGAAMALTIRARIHARTLTTPRARRRSAGDVAAMVAAALATMLAYEGIHRFVVTVVGLREEIAIIVAGFLEAAAFAAALLAKNRIANHGSGRIEIASTWAFAAASATIAGLSELLDPTTTTWTITPTTMVAALFRLMPALAACFLWGRTLHADREHANNPNAAQAPTRHQLRRARRIHPVALLMLRTRRLTEICQTDPTRWHTIRLQITQAHHEHRYAKLMRTYSPLTDHAITTDLQTTLDAYRSVEELFGTRAPAPSPRHRPARRADHTTTFMITMAAISITTMVTMPAPAATATTIAAITAIMLLILRRTMPMPTPTALDTHHRAPSSTTTDRIGFAEGNRVIHVDSTRVAAAVRVHLDHPGITRDQFSTRTKIRGGSLPRYHTIAQALAAEFEDPAAVSDADIEAAVARAAADHCIFSRPTRTGPLEVAPVAA